MDISFGDEKKMDYVITRVSVINPSITPVPLPQKYRCLFHGASEVPYGRHTFRFPITSLWYKRLVSSFQADFIKRLIVDFKAASIDEI